MYHGYVSWLCILAMYLGYVSWLCITPIYHAYVSRLCIMAMYHGCKPQQNEKHENMKIIASVTLTKNMKTVKYVKHNNQGNM